MRARAFDMCAGPSASRAQPNFYLFFFSTENHRRRALVY